jgi:hypothetical protein
MNRITLSRFGWPFFSRREPEVRFRFINQIMDAALGIAQVPGLRFGPAYVSCTNGTVLNIGAMAFAMCGNANTTLTLAASTYTPTGLSANTWYYLYVYSSAGVLTVEHSTTEPDASLAFKSGDTARLYIGCFRTNVSGVILPFRKAENEVTYIRTDTSVEYLTVLSQDNTTNLSTFVSQSLAVVVPPHSRVARLEAWFQPSFNGFDSAAIRTPGSTGAGSFLLTQYGANANSGLHGSIDVTRRDIQIVTDEVQQIEYATSNLISDAACDTGLTVIVNGFLE